MREIKSLVMNNGIEYFLKCMELIVSILRSVDLDCSKLLLIYDTWDKIIKNVKAIVFEHEGKDLITGQSNFFVQFKKLKQ